MHDDSSTKILLLSMNSSGYSVENADQWERKCVCTGFSLTDQDISTMKAIKPCLTIFNHHLNIPHKIPTCTAGWAS